MTHIEIALATPQGTETPVIEMRAFPVEIVTFVKTSDGRCKVIVAARGLASAGTTSETYEEYETVLTRLSSNPSGNIARVSSGDLTSANDLRAADVTASLSEV